MTTEKPRKSEHRFSLTRTVDRECLEEKDKKSIGIGINYAPNCNDCTSTEQVMQTRTLTGDSTTFPDLFPGSPQFFPEHNFSRVLGE